MQLKPFSIKRFLLKISLFVAIFYAFVILTSIVITAYLFLSLDSYKTRIEGVIYKHTGYNLTVGNIKTSLSSSLRPEVIINNATLTNPGDARQNFKVKQLQLVFAYSSIWNLEPIFDQINIDTTDFNLEYLKDGSIVFNGININHPDQKTLENTRNSPIDLELWLLKQKQIKLSNINLSFWDKKNNLPKLELYNVTTTLQYNYKNQHTFLLTIGKSHESQEEMLGAKLNWTGGRVTEFYDWQSAELKVQSFNENDTLAGTVKQYLPGVNIADTFNADTAIDAQIKNGKLQFFYANFDIKNLRYALTHHQNLINFPQLGGQIKINLANNDHYTLEANNFNIASTKGYILNNESITGTYTIGKKGSINITDTDIKSFNNLLNMFPATSKFSISGSLELIRLSWLGRITHPSSFNVLVNFKDLAIISKDPEIPSIDHISGNVILSKESGTANITLQNSTLIYPKIFLIPYKFNLLTTKVNWQFNKNKTLDVILGNTTINTVDFKGTASGKYTYTPKTHGFLDLKAHIDKVLTTKVGDYLPIKIGESVHKWLDNALIGGYAVNANLTLKGWLSDFPFTDGKGMFYIDTNVEHAKLRYIEEWPTLDDITGKFQIRNQKIIITASDAKISGNTIHNATVIIPNMVAEKKVYLTADGEASGTTSNFMTYLRQTPINEIIGKIPEKVQSLGNGNAKIHLMVPFADPEHTLVNGDYTFINNNLQFDLPIPDLSNVSGTLHFSEKGVKIDKISETVLNSQATIKAITADNGNMQFYVFSPNLNYKLAAKFYAPFLEPIINGNSTANVYFEIGKKGISEINVKSNLYGVAIAAPSPLKKESTTTSNLTINLEPDHITDNFIVNLNYANSLFGKIQFKEHGELDHAYLSIGSKEPVLFTANKSKIIIRVDTPYIYGEDWLNTVLKIVKADTSIKNETLIKSESAPIIEVKSHAAQQEVFPIEVIYSTTHLMLSTADYFYADGDILVLKDMTLFNINNTLTNGFGSYTYANKNLGLLFNDFNILKAVDVVRNTKKKNMVKPITSGTDFAKLNQNIAVNANTNVHFNESAYTLKMNKQNLSKFIESAANSAMNFPNIKLVINNLYYENVLLAQAKVNLRPSGNDLLIESGEILGKVNHTTFHGVNYCMECGTNKAFVELTAHLEINDLGKMLDNIGYTQVVAKANGTIDGSLQWNGKIQDFNLAHSIGSFKVDLKNGKFLKVSTGSIFGEIIGLINLQTITNFAHLDFSEAFSNGFYFNTLKIRAYLLNNVLTIKSVYMTGPLATVLSYGTIDVNNEMVDSYISIVPKLGAGIAVGAAAATLNPFVGLAVYAGELILGDPFNKLFSFAYHITGSLKKPTITKVKVSKQLWNNLNSALGLSGVTSSGK
ncbi:MAG: hypothetical protein QG673_2196 [Pseudomonadota bacterium]|nr:hypothetical protein [Pseudomonadota bacterium]